MFSSKPNMDQNITQNKPSQSSTSEEESQILPPDQKAKAIMMGRISGTLTTVGIDIKSEVPLYGSIMPFVLHKRWYAHPILAIRNDEKHYKNIQGMQKSAFTLFPLTPSQISPSEVPIPRVNMTGDIIAISNPDDVEIIITKFGETHPGSLDYLRTNEFSYYEFDPKEVHLMDCTGKLTTVSGDDFRKALEDPIAPVSRKIIESINSRYKTEISTICHKYGEVEVTDGFIYALDKLGFDILGKETASGNWLAFRMPWPTPISNASEYEIALTQAMKDVLK